MFQKFLKKIPADYLLYVQEIKTIEEPNHKISTSNAYISMRVRFFGMSAWWTYNRLLCMHDGHMIFSGGLKHG
jgi:hypothetical protein